jgi:Tol biopolymer transport system component
VAAARTAVVASVIGVAATVGVISASAGSPQLGPSAASSEVPEGARPSVSGDGRWVVFEGVSTDGGRRTTYRTDRETATTVELSPLPDGLRPGDTVNPVISADGCVVVVQSELALDVFRDDDTGQRWDSYRLVVPECGGAPNAWELVSVSAETGTARDDVVPDHPAAVSGSGAVVAYTHPLAGAPDGVSTITIVDLTLPVGDAGRDQQVFGMPAEAPDTVFRYRGAGEPVLSANGRHLAFTADVTASEPLPGWADGPVPGDFATRQVYVWDRADTDRFTAVQLVSGRDGGVASTGAGAPAISEDGRIVAFVSSDQSLVPGRYPRCAPECPTQVFRYDRDTDGNGVFDEPPRQQPLRLVSSVPGSGAVPGGREAGDRSSWAPAVNVDGSQVAFVTDASNLSAVQLPGGGTEADGDIVVADVLTDVLRRPAQDLTSVSVPAAHGNPALSDTGRVVVFDSVVAGVLTGDASLQGRHVVSATNAPRLSIAAADFGTVLVGWESAELYVSVLNDGPGAFEPAEVSSSSPNFRVTGGGTCQPGAVVPAGGTCTVYLTFNPTAPTAFEGTITVAERGHEAVSVSTQVRGTGGEPMLQPVPPGLDLEGGVVGGEGTRRTIDIENVAFAPTSVSSIRVVGTNPDDFAVVGESCTNRALNPSATCTIEIEFRPTAAGRRTAVVQVGTPGGPYTAAIVAGTGRFQPTVELVESVVDVDGTLGIGGAGFPANSKLVLRFADGTRAFSIVDTNADGRFLAEVPLPPRERPGERTLVVVGPDDTTASTTLTIRGREAVLPGTPGFGLGG